MRFHRLAFAAAWLMAGSIALAQTAEQYGPFNLDGGKDTCRTDKGEEIKKYQTYKAPPDRFFVEDSIKVTKISGWAPKKHSCAVSDVQKKKIKAKTDYGEIEVSVVEQFTVFAHADCGSGYGAQIGKTINIECQVEATMQKYSNK